MGAEQRPRPCVLPSHRMLWKGLSSCFPPLTQAELGKDKPKTTGVLKKLEIKFLVMHLRSLICCSNLFKIHVQNILVFLIFGGFFCLGCWFFFCLGYFLVFFSFFFSPPIRSQLPLQRFRFQRSSMIPHGTGDSAVALQLPLGPHGNN